MEFAHEIEWQGDSEERFIHRAIEREAWGNYEGNPNLGQRLVHEVQGKIKEISGNLNLYQERDNKDRVVALPSNGYELVYQKEYFKDGDLPKIRLVVVDVRKSY